MLTGHAWVPAADHPSPAPSSVRPTPSSATGVVGPSVLDLGAGRISASSASSLARDRSPSGPGSVQDGPGPPILRAPRSSSTPLCLRVGFLSHVPVMQIWTDMSILC